MRTRLSSGDWSAAVLVAGAVMMLTAERNRRKKNIRSWRFLCGYFVFMFGALGMFL